ARFAARGRPFSPLQQTQAQRPRSATMLRNDSGTAPGLHAVVARRTPAAADSSGAAAHDQTDIFCLPGPPSEMQPMFRHAVVPALRSEPGRTVLTRFVHIAGMAEGDAATKLGALMDRARNPLVGITASSGILTCRVRYEGRLDAARAAGEVDDTERQIREAIGPQIFGVGDDSLASAVIRELTAASQT